MVACLGILFLTIYGADYSKNSKSYTKVPIETHKVTNGIRIRVLSLFNTGLILFNKAMVSSIYIRIPYNLILYDV